MVEDVVTLMNGTYDVHTKFKYSFQDPAYRNKMRDTELEKQFQKKPEMAKAQANIPG